MGDASMSVEQGIIVRQQPKDIEQSPSMEVENLVNNSKLKTSSLSRRSFDKSDLSRSREQFLAEKMDDEFNNTSITAIQPLRSVIVKVPEEYKYSPDKRPLVDKDITDELAKNFMYYSRTLDLEFDTPEKPSVRVQILQRDVLDKMTAGTGIKTRVVIMNKGEDPRAFVCPDGTVFISQSLLNRMDNLDEIAGVLAHELTHLINKTAYETYKDSGRNRFGIGWVHEEACDANAPALLEKAGFNSLAFSTAIEKISGIERGSIHQSGLSRASQSMGHHMAIDRLTSSRNLSPIPQVLKRDAKKTNVETIDELLNIPNKTKKTQQVIACLRKLHPNDLKKIYDRSYIFSETVYLISERLKEAGYTKEDRDLFIISLGLFPYIRSNYLHPDTKITLNSKSLDIFRSPQDIVRIVKAIGEFEEDGREEKMHQLLFGIEVQKDPILVSDTTEHIFLSMISEYLYDVDVERGKDGIPVTRQSLMDTLEIIQHLNSKNGLSEEDKEHPITKICMEYIARTYLAYAAEAGEQVDPEQIKIFFEECKERGIKLSTFTIDLYCKGAIVSERPGKKHKDSSDSLLKLKQAYFEVNPEEKGKEFALKEIDDFFKDYKNGNEREFEFLVSLRSYLDKNSFTDEQRLELLTSIAGRIDETKYRSSMQTPEGLKSDEIIYNHLLDVSFFRNFPYVAFNHKLIVGLTLFKDDGPEFYKYMNKIMNESGINADELSQTELLNLCQGIFYFDSNKKGSLIWYGRYQARNLFAVVPDGVQIHDYNVLLELPFLKKIIEKEEQAHFDSWDDLNNYTELHLGKIIRSDRSDGSECTGIFDETLHASIVGKTIRENAVSLLEKGVNEKDLLLVGKFVLENYQKGVRKDNFIREIRKRILNSQDISFDDKVKFLVDNFDSVGLEGMVMLAERIEDMETYKKFRSAMSNRLEQYLEGSGLVTAIAIIDLVSTDTTEHFDSLFNTSINTPDARKETSTEVAINWFETINFHSINGMVYDKEKSKFVLDETSREIFRSFRDVVDRLKNLSPIQRFALAHKALTEQYGAFSSEGNKKKLGRSIVDSLGLNKGFLADVLRAACIEADPKLISFPTSMMLGPLLFRSLDVGSVDISKVLKYKPYHFEKSKKTALADEYSSEETHYILGSHTRDITIFGAKYQKDPDSIAALLTQENDEQYQKINGQLDILLGNNEEKKPEEKRDEELDPALEAIIKGVENSGPLGIRALQLTAQFHKFTLAVARRLSDTFDRNPGLNKLLFWENLHKLSLEDPDIGEFMQHIKLGTYLGGGSLQTTYSAEYTGDNGETKQIIVKMKNPNIEAFIREGYSSAHKTLEAVSQKRFGKNREYAQMGMVLIDLAQKWCIDDINDATFVQDDDLFRTNIVDVFNQSHLDDAEFYVPERLFTQSRLKSEDLAPGKTLNQFLKEESVSVEEKRQVIKSLSTFFLYQMEQSASMDADGKEAYLIHSDPHVGNYIVDTTSGSTRIGVIDRSLYLKLTREDIKILEKLIVKGNNTEFADSFIERVLNINKVRGAQRAYVKGRVFAKLVTEGARQMARGGVDRTSLMRTMLTELSDRDMDIPLNVRLMIRNIGAFQELLKRYDLDLEERYLNLKSKV